MKQVIFARHGGYLQFAIRMTREIKSAACWFCCDGDRARRWEHRWKYSQEVWRKSLSHLTIRSCVATAIVFWIFTLGFEFAGSVATSSDGRFRVAIILINFQLIINCCFNEAFPFVIIYKINFDIWKLNFLSNFGTDRPLYCTLIGKGPKDSFEPKIKNTLSCWYWGSGGKHHLSTHTAGLVDCIDWCIRFSQEQAGF